MASVSSEAVAKWWSLFERNARRFDGLGGAEFDDLVQEQAEATWLNLERGYAPTDELLERACLAWVRFTSHRGLAHDEHPYVEWVLHDDYDDSETRTDL
jgi:hypothetical protein